MKVTLVSKSDSTIKAAACEIGSLYTDKNGTLVMRVDDDGYDCPFLYMAPAEKLLAQRYNRQQYQIVDYDENDRFTYVGELKFS